MITGQVENIVFDGTRPSIVAKRIVRGVAWPWLIQVTDVAGDVVDLSSSTATSWGIEFKAWDQAGNVLLDVTTTATTGGSQCSLPNSGTDGELLVYLSATDTALLPDPGIANPPFGSYQLTLTDLAGVSYAVAHGLVLTDDE